MGILLSRTLLSWREPLVVAVVHRNEARRSGWGFSFVLWLGIFLPLAALAYLLFLRDQPLVLDARLGGIVAGVAVLSGVIVKLAESMRRNFAKAMAGNRIFLQEEGIAVILDGGLPVTWSWEQIAYFNFDLSLTEPSVLILNFYLPGEQVLQFGVDPVYSHEQVMGFLQGKGLHYHDRRLEDEAEAMARAEATAAASHSRLVPTRAFDPDLAFAQRI